VSRLLLRTYGHSAYPSPNVCANASDQLRRNDATITRAARAAVSCIDCGQLSRDAEKDLKRRRLFFLASCNHTTVERPRTKTTPSQKTAIENLHSRKKALMRNKCWSFEGSLAQTTNSPLAASCEQPCAIPANESARNHPLLPPPAHSFRPGMSPPTTSPLPGASNPRHDPGNTKQSASARTKRRLPRSSRSAVKHRPRGDGERDQCIREACLHLLASERERSSAA